MILDLIKGYTNQPFTLPYKVINFPDGHKHIDLSDAVTLIKGNGNIQILTRIRNFDDMFILLQAVDAIRELNIDVKLTLFCTYLIAGRYDRRMYPGDSFDLKIIAKLINDMQFRKVIIIEPHSSVSTSLIERVEVQTPLDGIVADYIFNSPPESKFVIFAPDLGAVKRVENLIKVEKLPAEVGYLHKTRNLMTGDITGMKIMDAPEVLEGKTIILFDDLCDGGRTFTEAAKIIRKDHPKIHGIVLAITHGLFSKGYAPILENGIDFILTTDSFQNQVDNKQVISYSCM